MLYLSKGISRLYEARILLGFALAYVAVICATSAKQVHTEYFEQMHKYSLEQLHE